MSTAGVTLGTGEGGNAFGDRFFIRGFDARNDIFIDSIRDAGVSVRENFFTEQIEIFAVQASSFAGRGTAGGAINIVTKQASDARQLLQHGYQVWYRLEPSASPRRQPGDQPNARHSRRRVVPGRRCRRARSRDGQSKRRPLSPRHGSQSSDFRCTANYIHTELTGCQISACPTTGQAQRPRLAGPFRISAQTALIGMAS